MTNAILKTHTVLLRTVIVMTTLTIALTLSRFVQIFSRKGFGSVETLLQAEYILALVLLAILTLPTLRWSACVAPHKPFHALIQIGLGLVGGWALAGTMMFALHAPLALWGPQFYIAPYIAILGGLIVLLMMCAGIARAFFGQKTGSYDSAALARIHRISGNLTASFALIIGVMIFYSIGIVGRPTTPQTMANALILLTCAGLLKWDRVDVFGLVNPSAPWHAITHFAVLAVCLHVIERITRAFLFHSGQFTQFADIEAAYPRFENLIMLPLTVFAMCGIALGLHGQDDNLTKRTAQEVFG